MIFVIVFFCLFIILLFISKRLVKNLFLFFYLLSKNDGFSITTLTWFLLPGTVIHEVSHMLVAELLGVKTGKFSFIPEALEDDRIQAGSLTMQKTDPVRQTLIGLSPILFGISIIFVINVFIFQPLVDNPQLLFTQNPQSLVLNLISLYLVFVISNTMFSSSKDLEQVLFPIVLVIILGGAFILGGFKLTFANNLIKFSDQLFKNINLSLVPTMVIDLFLLGLTKIINSVMMKLNAAR